MIAVAYTKVHIFEDLSTYKYCKEKKKQQKKTAL